MIDCVVMCKTLHELRWLYDHHAKLLKANPKTRDMLILANGVRVHYVLVSNYYNWCLGRTYMHLIDYMMGNDVVYHGGTKISKEDIAKHFQSGGDSE